MRSGWQLVVAAALVLCGMMGREAMSADEAPVRPHLLVTAERVGDLRTVDDLRAAIEQEGHARDVWEFVLAQTEADLDEEPIALEGRNPSYRLVHDTAMRIMRAALAALVTGDDRYRDSSLAQMEAVFDETRWPDWRDSAHLRYPADLRTGQLARAIGFSYDWMHAMLSEQQRKTIVEGLDRRAIQPFWEAVDQGASWTRATTNWSTQIVGGLGIAGMALTGDHPDAERLVEYSVKQMRDYLNLLGPEGEFNESVGYSAAMRLPSQYFAAYRYHTGGAENMLAAQPLVDVCRWIMHQSVAPGRTVPFGDSHLSAPPPTSTFSAVAAAAHDPVLQWFYLRNAEVQRMEVPVLALLTYDDRIEPISPEGRMPHGRAYEAFGALVSSRTAWEPWAGRGVRCTVHSKAGIEKVHEHHDAGQVVINGFGERLIVDLGSPAGGYPADYGPPSRWKYYNASSWGHNVLNVVGREMQGDRDTQGEVLAAFDDALGAVWRMDLTKFYAGARSIVRTVVHLQPGIVAVLDEATFDASEEIRLRWHTVDRCEPDADGRFTVQGEKVRLVSRVIRLDDGDLTVVRDEHAYEAPYHLNRYDRPLVQRNESFIEARLRDRECRLLTVFAVRDADEPIGQWERTPTGLNLQIADHRFVISAADGLTASVDSGADGGSLSSGVLLNRE